MSEKGGLAATSAINQTQPSRALEVLGAMLCMRRSSPVNFPIGKSAASSLFPKRHSWRYPLPDKELDTSQAKWKERVNLRGSNTWGILNGRESSPRKLIDNCLRNSANAEQEERTVDE